MESILAFFKIRPAFKIIILFIVGLILGHYFDLSLFILFLILFVLFIAAILTLCGKVSLLNFVFIPALIIAGMLRYELATEIFPRNHIIHYVDLQEPITIIGNVAGFPEKKKNRVEVELTVKELINEKQRTLVCGKVLVRLRKFSFVPNYGDQLEIKGKIQQPRGKRNPGEFDYQQFLAANGIYGLVNISKPEQLIIRPAQHQKSIFYFVYVIKRKFYRTLNELHQGQAGTLIKGLLLGERGEISPELKVAFTRCGVIHILAVSGLNVGYIGVIFFVLFSLLRFNYHARIIAVLISVFFYTLLVGFEPPIVRASLMMGIFLVGRLIQRPTDALNVLSTAALIILLFNPPQFFQASFQLSFGAILSMVYLYQQLKIIFDKWPIFSKFTKSKVGEYVGVLFLVSLAAQLGTLPITVYYFGLISLIAMVLNLLVIPLTGIITALGFAALFFSLVSIGLAQFYAQTNTIFLNLLIQTVEKAGKIAFSSFETGKIGLMIMLLYYLLLWSLLNLNKQFYRKTFLFTVLIGAVILLWKPIFQHQKWLQVIFFDVGQGDAALITFPNGKNLLIDAGPQSQDFDAGEFFIVPYLKRERINQLNTVILSHSDNDHIGGMPAVFRNLSVDHIIDNGLFLQSGICSTFQTVIDSLKIEHQFGYAGQRLIQFEHYGTYILHPEKSFINKFKNDINNCSIVLKVMYGNRSFLFPGDIEKEAEDVLVNYGDILRADVLKLAHHGSETASTLEWLKRVHPEFAVISVGKNNRFAFPDSAVLRRLNELGIKTIRTDLNGAVMFRTDGSRLERIR